MLIAALVLLFEYIRNYKNNNDPIIIAAVDFRISKALIIPLLSTVQFIITMKVPKIHRLHGCHGLM